jgi:hypothetical protein
VDRAQVCKVTFLQLPAPSQALEPVHGEAAFGSSWPAKRKEHLPWVPATEQDLHVSEQASSQQVKSMQSPEAQSRPLAQVWPGPLLHAPDPSQADVPVHRVVAFPSG